jgi:hypothetical protein
MATRGTLTALGPLGGSRQRYVQNRLAQLQGEVNRIRSGSQYTTNGRAGVRGRSVNRRSRALSGRLRLGEAAGRIPRATGGGGRSG